MNIYLQTLKRDLNVAIRNPSSVLNPLLFFVISVSLFPLAISPEATTLSRVQECTSFHTSGSFLVTNIKIRSPCLLPPFIKVTVFSSKISQENVLC
jgi:hypothetical protein